MALKRKRTSKQNDHTFNGNGEYEEVEKVPASGSESENEDGAEVDIFTSLTGSGRQVENPPEENDDAEQFIRITIAKKNAKDGTEIVRKMKGKTRIVKGELGGGSFQSMMLQPWILRSLTLRGYRIPTPIQRLAVPALLSLPSRDLVGMARTGSGKTLAYMIPLLQRLNGMHSTTFGAKALILVPTRELAVQVMKVGKELARGRFSGAGASTHAGDAEEEEDKKGQGIRWGLLIGGEGMDEQFEIMASNPDVIIATPGRLLHLTIEASLSLSSVQYLVFDEADRLFEMGFETAMTEILNRLPASRQTLLFSATLPKSLVEFAKAGLTDPKLVRLDAESKISTELRMAFFSMKQKEKEACLLTLLRDVIKVPLGGSIPSATPQKETSKEKERTTELLPHQTLIFAATKHHVEYLTTLLSTAGYAVAHIYGTLDQHARSSQMDSFRRGQSSILVVTDVAARGIDIPVLENVINFDFPRGARVFVHRVGRTARAGRSGWAWSFVTHVELPFLVDLQLFLGRPLIASLPAASKGEQEFSSSLVLGPFPRSQIDEDVEYIRALDEKDPSLVTQRAVMHRGHGMYERSQGKASPASYTRAKAMSKDGLWGFGGAATGVGTMHPVFSQLGVNSGDVLKQSAKEVEAKQSLLQAVYNFRPPETVFEIGSRGKKMPGASVMQDRRKALAKAQTRVVENPAATTSAVDDDMKVVADAGDDTLSEDEVDAFEQLAGVEIFEADELPKTKRKGNKSDSKDSQFYMSHYQKDAMTDKGYSLKDGASFEEQTRNQTFSLGNDEGLASSRQRHHSQLNWDRKKKKFVKGTGEGADNRKMVKTESGTKLPATYRSGRFEEWQAKNKVSMPRVGEEELPQAKARGRGGFGGRKFLHSSVTAPKALDKQSIGFERKSRQLKKKQEGEAEAGDSPGKGRGNRPQQTRYGGKPVKKVRSEIKSVHQIRKSRDVQMRRKAKNARPTRKKGKR